MLTTTDNPLEGGAAVHAAILAVMRDVGYVQKGGQVDSPGARYRYAAEADLIAALRPSMLDAGLYCYVRSVAVATRAEFTTRSGSVQQNTVVKLTVRFVHAASGSYIDVEAVGEGADSGDKSAAKALTGAYKYALRETFCIETGDDPDSAASEERRASRPQEAHRGAPATRPPQRTAPPRQAPPRPAREPGDDDGYYDAPPDSTAGTQGAHGPQQDCPECGGQGATMQYWKPGEKSPDLQCNAGCEEEYNGKARPLRWWSHPKGV